MQGAFADAGDSVESNGQATVRGAVVGRAVAGITDRAPQGFMSHSAIGRKAERTGS